MAAKTVRIYGIRNCDTMKKAFAWLDAHGVAYEFHDYKKAGVPVDRLDAWMKRVGWEKLVNTRGPTFRKLPESMKEGLNEAKAAKLLVEHSSAIKRPVLEVGKDVVVGFDEEVWGRTLG